MTLTWPVKDPDAVADYANVWDIGADSIVTSTWTFAAQAGLAKDSDTFSGSSATIWLSGGTAGQVGILVNRIVTAGGRTFDSEPIYLPIQQTYPVPTPPGSYVAPSAAWLLVNCPAFAAVDPAIVTEAIRRAGRMVDASWMEGDYADGIMLLACHYMVLAGLGTGAEAQANAQGMAGFSMIRSGQLTLQRGATSRTDGVPSPWNSSAYGIQFYWLMRRNRPAITVSDGPDLSAYMLDAPAWYP